MAKKGKERRKLRFAEKLTRLIHDATVEGRFDTASKLLAIAEGLTGGSLKEQKEAEILQKGE